MRPWLILAPIEASQKQGGVYMGTRIQVWLVDIDNNDTIKY